MEAFLGLRHRDGLGSRSGKAQVRVAVLGQRFASGIAGQGTAHLHISIFFNLQMHLPQARDEIITLRDAGDNASQHRDAVEI